MQLSRRLAPLLYNSVAAIVGTAIGLVLIRGMANQINQENKVDLAAVHGRIDPQPISPTARPADDRTANELLAALRAPLRGTGSSSDAAPWTTSVTKGAESPAAWSTEIQVAPPTAQPANPSPSEVSPQRAARKPLQSIARRYNPILRTRLAQIAPAAKARLAAKFDAAKAPWPPDDMALIAIKDQKAVELYARAAGGDWQFIHRYPVLAASGRTGPKLQQGDRQVPEGVYRIVYLNPRSAYHVSLRVNYPNAFDRRMAAKDGRKKLGGDIMIYGKKSSAGCLAMGDPAAEELFVLAAETGYSKVKLIIAPTDFRLDGLQASRASQPKWLPELYAQIATAMADFKAPQPSPPSGLLSLFTR